MQQLEVQAELLARTDTCCGALNDRFPEKHETAVCGLLASASVFYVRAKDGSASSSYRILIMVRRRTTSVHCVDAVSTAEEVITQAQD